MAQTGEEAGGALQPSPDTTDSALPPPAPPPAPPPTPPPDPASTGRLPALAAPEPPPDPARRSTTGATVVIEEGAFRTRLRRPRDLVGAVAAVLGALAVVGIAMAAQTTTIAIDSDLARAQSRLPDLVALLLNSAAGLGIVLLPLTGAISLLVRRRGRQLLEAIGALVLADILLSVISVLVSDHGSESLFRALTGAYPVPGVVAYPTAPLLGGLVAFVTVARLMARPRWKVAATALFTVVGIVGAIAPGSTIAAQGLSILVGAAVGLMVRYALGTPTTRPAGTEVARTLAEGGLPLVMLRASEGTGSGRRYHAVTLEGEQLDIVVLDRDLEGSGVDEAIWRAIRLRGHRTSGSLSMSAAVDRAALMSYAAQAAQAPTPHLRVASMVSADSALLAYEARGGRVVPPGSDTARPTRDELEAAWRAVARLQARFLAHQDIHAANIHYLGPDTYLTGVESGVVAAGDITLRLDVAEMLVTQALQTDVASAVAAGRAVLGDEALLRALPVLQAVALSGPTRAALRARKGLLNQVREALLEVNPAIEVEPINLERLKPRTVVTMLLGTVAGYLLLSQLAQVDLVEVVTNADWRWALIALALSVTTYVGATLSLSGFVPDRLPFFNTFKAQLAASFATLVSPPTLGAVAVNARYLNRAGLPPAASAASIAVSQLVAFGVHVSLMLLVGIAAGTQTDMSFDPPREVVIGIGVLAIVIGGLASVSQIRRWLTNRIRPMVDQVVPRLLTVAQRPAKLIEGFGGILMLNLAYCLCLVACVRAFTDSGSLAAISFVYLAGSTIGQAAPTPGGLGVVEAALAAGLTAAGVESGLAVSATLLFRTVTFWLPTIPGWFSFRSLSNRGLL